MKLWDNQIARIDKMPAEPLDLLEYKAEVARVLSRSLMERRLVKAEEARPTAISGGASKKDTSNHKGNSEGYRA